MFWVALVLWALMVAGMAWVSFRPVGDDDGETEEFLWI
jgi:hypothetical protein